MKANINIYHLDLVPDVVLNLLIEGVVKEANKGCDDDDTTKFPYSISYEGWYIEGYFEFENVYVDDTFSHAFGTEYCYHYELGDLCDIDILECHYEDNEGNVVNTPFPYERFNNLFENKRMVKRNSF